MDGILVSGKIKGVLTFGRVFRRANRENGRSLIFGFQYSYLPAKDLDGLQRFLRVGHDVMLRAQKIRGQFTYKIITQTASKRAKNDKN